MVATTQDHILELGKRWAEAEQQGDNAALDAMTTKDFTLVGPVGFVLEKGQWLECYRSGGLVTKTLAWNDVTVREYDSAAITIGIQAQQATFQGDPVDGEFRVTHVWVRDGSDWKLASIHLSTMGGPPPFAPRGS